MSKKHEHQQVLTPAPEKPIALGLPHNRPKRFLCFECPAHAAFTSLQDFKDHIAHGHIDPI